MREIEKRRSHFMFQRGFFIMLFAFAMMFSNQAVADQDPKGHAHKTPHGGIVQEAEGMHAEFLLDKSGEPKFYLYDKAMKPLDRGDLEAKLTVKGHGGEQHARELKFSKDPKEGPLFKGEPLKGLKDWDTAVVSLKIKDKWTHFRFSHH
ncbi:MAG: hypothetical protein ACREQW_14375 [Candidatus Binatia bacterium]